MSIRLKFFFVILLLLTGLFGSHGNSFGMTLLFSDDFESGMGNWSNVTADDNKDWTRDSGGTPSSNTGPSSGADASTYYVYLETSSGAAYTAGDTAILLGPVINGSNIRLSFRYHMYGTDIGTLAVDVLSDGAWINNVMSISGQQQFSNNDAYAAADVDLSTYSVTQIRFRATAAGYYMGDIAIDNIEIWSTPSGPVAPEFTGNPLEKPDAYQNYPYSNTVADDAFDDNGDTLSFSKISGPDWLNVSPDGTLSGSPESSDVGLNSFIVQVSDGILSSTTTVNIYVNDVAPPILFNRCDFELDTCDWSNVTTGDNYDWTRDSGGTPSSNTGPSSGADGSVYYMYLETSSGSAYTAGDTAILLGPPVIGTHVSLNFQYHMYGIDTGTLAVDVFSEGTWIEDVWSISGQQHTSSSAPYTSVSVDLSDYSLSQIRLRAIAAGNFMGDIAIDNVEIWASPPGPLAPEFYSDPLVKSNAYRNYAYSDNIAADAFDDNGDALVFSKISGPAWLDVAQDGSLSGTPGCNDVGLNTFVVEASDGQLAGRTTLAINVINGHPPVLISRSDFELGYDDWSNTATGDNYNWIRNSGGTPSSGTGPSSGADGSAYYMYFETSSGYAYRAGDTAILLGPAISGDNILFKFKYHMFGSTIGTLAVDVLSAGTWINDVWSISGQQQSSNGEAYAAASVDLSGYTLSQIRFRATAAGNYLGDIAIDDVEIYSSQSVIFDSDNDGVEDCTDICAGTPAGEPVDANGCSESQKDTDGDGITDNLDICPNTPTGETVDANGCSDTQKDTDNDGVGDNLDACPNTPSGEAVYANGCSDSQINPYQPTIGAGYWHTAAVSDDGRLLSWGYNSNGLLGNGAAMDEAAPIQIGIDNDWRAIATGPYHSAAIKTDGTLWAWGDNDYGQLGDGTTTQRTTPVQISAANDWLSVSVGTYHTVAIKKDGRLFAWGRNSDGQLGDGTFGTKTSPTQVGTDNDWIFCSAGAAFTAAIKMDGSLYTWGNNDTGQLGLGSSSKRNSPTRVGTDNDWAFVTAGSYHAAAVKTDGTLYCWGRNQSGQIGNGTTTNVNSPSQIGSDSNWMIVSAGTEHTVAIKTDGTIYAWGGNSFGTLGDGTEAQSTSPVQIGFDSDWVSVSAGGYHNIAKKSDGTIYTWGRNGYGALGIGVFADKHLPTPINPGSSWESVYAGKDQTIAIKTDGTLYAWGTNGYGQLGDGTTENKNSPVQIASGIDFASISVGYYHTVGITTDGALYAWGFNNWGQLGDGTTAASSSPIRIGFDNDWLVAKAGLHYTVALKTDGSLYAWGMNNQGQLGDGTTTDRHYPIQIGTDSDWSDISLGDSQTYALKTDGSLWAWGDNYYGQVGDGTTTDRTTPVQIGPDYNWLSIESHGDHALALKTDGSLFTWGYNYYGQLGDGTTTNRSYPIQIGTNHTWMAIAAGTNHSLAITTDGMLYAWGANGWGQLGDGTTTQSTTPIQISADNDWYSVAAGYAHSLALKTEAALYGWGFNTYGQLGDGTAWVASPILINLD